MTIYNRQQWLEKCENDALENCLLMPAQTENDLLRRSQSIGDVSYYMRNKLFLEGIYEEVGCQLGNILNQGQ